MKVVITESLAINDKLITSFEKDLSSLGHQLEVYHDKADDEELIRRLKDADIAIIANHPLRENVLSKCSTLQFIDVAFTGLDHVDLAYAKEKGIIVKNAAGYADTAVAELVIGLNIALNRDILKADKKTRTGETKTNLTAREIKGKKVGIVGTGNIGISTAKLYQAFGADLYAYSRSQRQEFLTIGRYISLEELFKSCDIISLHLPLNNDTQGMINEELIALMKRDAILINCARGGIVDNKALSRALINGEILGAGIDVFDIEPPLTADCPYFKAENSILTPHLAYYSLESMQRRAKIVFDNCLAYIKAN